MKVTYATHADVLYIVLQDVPSNCAYVELESGAICRVDESTDKVVGITIPDFKRRMDKEGSIIIPELVDGISAASLMQE
jgi:uncharacterized protein YuzE